MAKKALLKDGRALCSACARPVKPDEKACSHCKEALEGDFEALLCPDCKILLANGTSKCYNCGLKFKTMVKKREPVERAKEDEAFLWRLLNWSEEEIRKGGSGPTKVMVPVIENGEIERYQKEEAKAEKIESAQALVDAFNTIISARRAQFKSGLKNDGGNVEVFRKEALEFLMVLEDLTAKVELLFNDLMEKHHLDILEREAEFRLNLEKSKKTIEDFERDIRVQQEHVQTLKAQLQESGIKIKKLEMDAENGGKGPGPAADKEFVEQLKKIFKVIDDLLGKLPDKEVEEFAKSPDFKVYEKVLEKLSI